MAQSLQVTERTVWRWLAAAESDEAVAVEPGSRAQTRDRFTVTPEVCHLLALWKGNVAAVHRELTARAARQRPSAAPPSLPTLHRAIPRVLTPGERAGLTGGGEGRPALTPTASPAPGHEPRSLPRPADLCGFLHRRPAALTGGWPSRVHDSTVPSFLLDIHWPVDRQLPPETVDKRCSADVPGRWVDWAYRVPTTSWISTAWRSRDDWRHTGARHALDSLIKNAHTRPYEAADIDWSSWRTYAAATNDPLLTMIGFPDGQLAIGHATPTTAALIHQNGTILSDSPDSPSLAVLHIWLEAWEAAERPAPETCPC